jgi:uncharacterized protein YcbK (DUF882 family)
MIHRRDFLRAGMAAIALEKSLFAGETRFGLPSQRLLAFHHVHTGENLKCIYWEKGAYVPEALAESTGFCATTGEMKSRP